jgi:hypothetical protein
MKLQAVSLKRSDHLDEKWVQAQIADDPSLLGLADLDVRDKERIQPNAGRLDLLLQDPESLKRYEVETRLGQSDESHIIRTIEYWDIERKRYPQYEHCAVIVAEEITARFLNVIHLFNGAIPLIALKMTAYQVGSECALTFVKVLDEVTFGLVDEDEPIAAPADRNFWESKRGTKATMALTDALFQLVHEVEPKPQLKYNRHYIGLEVGGSPLNFVSFRPQKAGVILRIKMPQSKEVDESLEEAGFETLGYVTNCGLYRIRLTNNVEDKQREILLTIIRQARAFRV